MKKVFKWFAIFMAIMFVGSFIYVSTMNEKDLEKWEIEKREKAYAQFQVDSLNHCTDSPYLAEFYAQEFIKKYLNDPESFTVHNSKTVYNPNRGVYVVDLDYGARNGFGGMVRKRCLLDVKHTSVFDTIENKGKHYQQLANIEEF